MKYAENRCYHNECVCVLSENPINGIWLFSSLNVNCTWTLKPAMPKSIGLEEACHWCWWSISKNNWMYLAAKRSACRWRWVSCLNILVVAQFSERPDIQKLKTHQRQCCAFGICCWGTEHPVVLSTCLPHNNAQEIKKQLSQFCGAGSAAKVDVHGNLQFCNVVHVPHRSVGMIMNSARLEHRKCENADTALLKIGRRFQLSGRNFALGLSWESNRNCKMNLFGRMGERQNEIMRDWENERKKHWPDGEEQKGVGEFFFFVLSCEDKSSKPLRSLNIQKEKRKKTPKQDRKQISTINLDNRLSKATWSFYTHKKHCIGWGTLRSGTKGKFSRCKLYLLICTAQRYVHPQKTQSTASKRDTARLHALHDGCIVLEARKCSYRCGAIEAVTEAGGKGPKWRQVISVYIECCT